MNAKLLEERTVFKVVVPLRVERIRIRPDLDVTPDFGFGRINQPRPDGFPRWRPFVCVRRKVPGASSAEPPVFIGDPAARFARMSAFGPLPEGLPHSIFHFLERLHRHNVAVVVHPTPNDRVELSDQVYLTGSAILTHQLPHLFQKSMRVLLGRPDNQLAVKLAEVLSEEVEPLLDVRDAGFLWRELQAPVAQKLLDQWLDFIFQHVLGRAGDDEVIRITNEVYLGIEDASLDALHTEALFQERFQSVQCQVGQRGRDNPALWRACLGGKQGSIFHEARLEPLAQHDLVSGNMPEHPFVIDVIKTSTNVAFQHPLGMGVTAAPQCEEAVSNGIRRTAFRPEAVGAFVRRGFRDGQQRQQMQCLHGAVCHRRDAQRSQLPVGFRNVDSSQRLRVIPAPLQPAQCFVFRRRSAPYFPVHSRRAFALIVCHSFHGQGFAGKRAGQQPLQSFDFAPTLFLCCLDDTRLQPSDVSFTLSPVNLFPSGDVAGGCTRGLLCVHLRFPPVKVLRVLSPRTTRWKSARLHGGVMSQLLSVPLQNGIGFFQHPLPATPSAFLADAPASTRRRNVGFTMFDCNDTNELTPALHTGSCVCPRAPCVRRSNQLRAFWPEPVSVFGSLSMTMPTAVHLCWVFHPACPSDRINARSRRNHLAAVSSSLRWKHVVPAASDPTVAGRASAGRLLRTESQVRLTNFISYRTIIVTTSFHTAAILLARARGRRNKPRSTGHALPLAFALFLRLAQISPMAARSPARRPRDDRETSGKTTGEISCAMLARSPARSITVHLARHPAKCFARANRVANFVASDVALRFANHVAKVVASPVDLLLLTALRMLLPRDLPTMLTHV